MCSHSTKWIVFVHLFQKVARVWAAVAHISPFIFCQSFFFVAIPPKKKALEKQTIFSYQDFLAAFFDGIGAKKANKETPIRLRGGRHYSWRATFKKVDKTTYWLVQTKCSINQNLKSLFQIIIGDFFTQNSLLFLCLKHIE